MKSRYFLVLCLALVVGVASGSSVYQLIGTGGSDKFDLNLNSTQKNDSLYEIYLAQPVISTFYIPQNYSSDIIAYIYDDEITLNGGHVFEFEGHMEVENDHDTYSIEVPGPSRIIVENFGDITCSERYNSRPQVCYIKSTGYLVDADHNLHRIGNVKIITDKGSSFEYLGTRCLLRFQRVRIVTEDGLTDPKYVPDPGDMIITWSGVERRPIFIPPTIPSDFAIISLIDVSQIYMTAGASGDITNVTYSITASNTGETKLKNVTLTDMLPPGMEFHDAVYSSGGEPDLLSLKRTKLDCEWLVNVVLYLGDLDTSESKLLLLNASHEGSEKEEDYYGNNSVIVFGEAADMLKVNASSDTAEPINNATGNETDEDGNGNETETSEPLENETESNETGASDNQSVNIVLTPLTLMTALCP